MQSKYDELARNFDDWLEQSCASFRASPLGSSASYTLLAPGKRLRPVLALATAAMLGAPINRVKGFALALEYIHAFSLVHDDLPSMDNAETRRGRPSCHIRFGDAHALLTGDALLARSFLLLGTDEALAPAERASLISLLSEAVVELCDGQLLDLSGGAPGDEPAHQEKEVFEVSEKKTGALIRAAVSGPWFLAVDKQVSELESLRKFGRALGLLFQLTDDLLDADVSNDPLSFVRVFGRERAMGFADTLRAEGEQALAAFGERASFHRWLFEYVSKRRQ